MSMVKFLRGSRANLTSTITDGYVYFCTDERSIYADVDATTRIRIGDFQEFATLAALQANTNPSTTALYYVTELNVLAKWDGTAYVQINLDTGATSATVTGTGNAIDGVTYDASTRTLTFTKTSTFVTADGVETQISEKVGSLVVDTTEYATVAEYVDAKTSGIATSDALDSLSTRVTAVESSVTTLNGDATTEGSVDKKISDAITALDLDNTYDAKGSAATAQAAADAAQADVDALEATVGTVAEGTTIVQMIADAQSAATYDDTALAARVTANETAISTLNGDATQTGSVAKQVSDAVAALVADAPEAYDTLKEISDWISSHADSAATMNSQITTNTNDITALETLVGTLPEGATSTTVVAYISEAISAIGIGDYAKAADLTAAVTRIADIEAKEAAWDAAEQNAKDYADGLASNYDAAGSAATALTEAKSYADGLASNYDAAGAADSALTDAKAYTDDAMTWGTF